MSRREQNRAAQRTRIIDSARELFTRDGFEEVTVADIAAAAGVARATVFNQFGSKHALVEALTEEVLEAYQAMLGRAMLDLETPTSVLVRALFEQMGVGIEWDRRFFRGVFREMARLQFGLDEGGPGQRASENAQARLIELIVRGQERGELVARHSPRALASAFTSLVNGTITHWLYADATEPLGPRMLAAADVFLAPVATDSEAGRDQIRPSLGIQQVARGGIQLANRRERR